eukprot:5239281-Prymnesium_polylepis.2
MGLMQKPTAGGTRACVWASWAVRGVRHMRLEGAHTSGIEAIRSGRGGLRGRRIGSDGRSGIGALQHPDLCSLGHRMAVTQVRGRRTAELHTAKPRAALGCGSTL